jgi:hypothetical protein
MAHKPKPRVAQRAATAHPFAAMNCPAQVTWSNDIKQLFTPLDVDHMKKAKNIDLSDYNSTKIWAFQIYNAVSSIPVYMPPPQSGEAPWTADMINTFGCWIKQGCPQ